MPDIIQLTDETPFVGCVIDPQIQARKYVREYVRSHWLEGVIPLYEVYTLSAMHQGHDNWTVMANTSLDPEVIYEVASRPGESKIIVNTFMKLDSLAMHR